MSISSALLMAAGLVWKLTMFCGEYICPDTFENELVGESPRVIITPVESCSVATSVVGRDISASTVTS